MAGKNFIAKATANKGGLHRATGTPMGKTIPKAKLAKAANGGFGPKAVKEANLARTLGKFRK